MKIAIDIDSTLHDYWEQFAAAVQRRFGVTLPYEDQVTWEVTLLRPEQVRAAVIETHGEPHVLASVWMGDLSLAEALRRRAVRLQGPDHNVRAFSRWFGLSSVAAVQRQAS